MKITCIDEAGRGECDLDGATYRVDLSLVGDASVGDYVIVHAGFAIEKLDEAEADARLELFAGMAASQRGEGA
jgi:hydrogenase expression/formation protein HypC